MLFHQELSYNEYPVSITIQKPYDPYFPSQKMTSGLIETGFYNFSENGRFSSVPGIVLNYSCKNVNH